MDGEQARSIRNMLFKNQQGRCHWCAVLCEMPYIKEGKKHTYVGPTTFTIEHVLSRSRGGNSSIKNLVGACSRCNNWRATVENCVEKGQSPIGRCRGMKNRNLWVYLPVELQGPRLKSGKWFSYDLKWDNIEEVNSCRVK
jgi:HNH endonuclease